MSSYLPQARKRKSTTVGSEQNHSRAKANPKSPEDESHLCARCAAFNFEEIFSTRVNRGLGDFVMSLEQPVNPRNAFGHKLIKAYGKPIRLQLRNDSTCRFCSLLAEMLPVFFDENNSSRNGQCHLRAFSTNRVFGGPNSGNFLDTDSTILGIVRITQAEAKSGKGGAMQLAMRSLHETGFLGPLIDSQPTNAFGLRQLCSKFFDVAFVQSCTSFCFANHGQACNSTAECENGKSDLSSLPSRVIDCKSRRIIKTPSFCTYLALSYLWGSKPTKTPRFVDGSSHSDPTLPDDCPLVINDSVEVTLKLGQQYLWVDRYCIDQTDFEEKSFQIARMDQIYANAHITIIAAAGDGPDHGLPGVNQTPRRRQPSIQLGGLKLVSSLPNPKWKVGCSKWATRGWTFQEGFLSKRRLIFTEEQISFECNTMDSTEVLWQPLGALHCKSKSIIKQDAGKRDLRAGIPGGVFSHRIPGKLPIEIMSYLSEYTRRDLTFASDALNAFQGIFHVFAKSEFEVYQLMGIPILPARHIQNPKHNFFYLQDPGQSFIVGLSWSHKTPGKRRPEFPSWSWAGWEGQLDDTLSWSMFWDDRTLPHRFTVALVEKFEDAKGAVINFTDNFYGLNSVLEDLQTPTKYVYIRASTYPCKLLHIDVDTDLDDEDRTSRSAPARSGYYIELVLHYTEPTRTGELEDDSFVYTFAGLDGPTFELVGKDLLCIPYYDSTWNEYTVDEQDLMIIQEHEGHWERVGMAAFHSGYMKMNGLWAGHAKWTVDGPHIQGRIRQTIRLG